MFRTLHYENETYKINWTAYPAGEHEIVAVIEPEDAISEINETNNIKSEAVIVQGPDLIVSDIKVLNTTKVLNVTNLTEGKRINITANISNIGVLPVNNSFNVSIYVDMEKIAERTLTFLDKNASRLVNASWNTTIGNHTIEVIVWDNGGNTKTIKYNVIVDKTPPEITIIETEDYIRIDITDSSPVSYQIYLNGELYNETLINKTTLPDGDYVIFVRATDAAGNTAEKTYSFIIDTTAPEICLLYTSPSPRD